VILVELAQFGLARRQPRDLRAQRLGSHHVELRIPPHLVALDAEIPDRGKKIENRKKEKDVLLFYF
jgi:hypothetical protein